MIVLYSLAISIAYLLAILIYFLDIHYMTINEVKVRSLQFKLFELRDRILRLIVDHKVDKEDKCFRLIYSIINSSIRGIRTFTMKNLLKAAKNTDSDIKQKADLIMREVIQRDNELKGIFFNYIQVIIEALVAFSPILRFYLRIKRIFFPRGLGNERRERLSRMPIIKEKVETYTVKKDLENFLESCSVEA